MSKSTISVFGIAAAIFVSANTTGFIAAGQAQSFSCANAQIPSEMAICNNESLLIKDEQVAELLASRLVKATSLGNVQSVSQEHGQWLKLRNSCSNDMACLEKRYDERIYGLTGRDL